MRSNPTLPSGNPDSRRQSLRVRKLIPFLVVAGAVLALAQHGRYYYDSSEGNYGGVYSRGSGTTARRGYYSPGYTAPYGYGTLNTSPWDRQRAAMKVDRQVRIEDQKADRAARDAKLEQEAEERRRNAYVPPPSENPGISISRAPGISSQDTYDSRVDAEIRRNQDAARERYSAPQVEAPRYVPGMTMIGVGDDYYYYKDGKFYTLNKNEKLVQILPPLGATVFDLPESTTQVTVDSTTYYSVGETFYARSLLMGQVVYEVVEDPRA